MSKILLAEDDKFTSRAYKNGLEEAGFEVKVVETGTEALESVEEEKPDLLLLDLMMPKLDGVSVLKQMKENPETDKIPVIILTNLSDKKTLAAALEVGATDYLVKTDFTLDDVVAKIKAKLSYKS